MRDWERKKHREKASRKGLDLGGDTCPDKKQEEEIDVIHSICFWDTGKLLMGVIGALKYSVQSWSLSQCLIDLIGSSNT